MNKCPITYEIIEEGLYSIKGLQKINPKLKMLNLLDFTKEELLAEAELLSEKMSIEGVQPKISAVISVIDSKIKLVGQNGLFIIKPQHEIYQNVPENEDLTMRLAELVKIEVPFHGLIYDKEGNLHYFIKRFDRMSIKKKYPVEDFAQLICKNRDTKYNSSMEKVGEIIEEFCTFPIIEKVKLFRLTLFNYLIGNEDMHLKNFSLITKNNKTTLSPAYDLLNTSIIIKNAKEEIALPIKGKKNNLTRKDIIEYFGKERLGLNAKTIDKILMDFTNALPNWYKEIEKSFLPENLVSAYLEILKSRVIKIGLK